MLLMRSMNFGNGFSDKIDNYLSINEDCVSISYELDF